MSGMHESQAVLRQALESIDHIRQRMLWAGYVAVAATLGAFAWLDDVAKSNASERSVIMAAILALTCVIAWSTFALALLVTPESPSSRPIPMP